MSSTLHRYFAVHKPYGMLSQFRGGHPGFPMLGSLDFRFPEETHAVGRLDYTSEGLLLLTTDTSVTRLLFHPAAAHPRVYLVNVYKRVSDDTVARLAAGITIRVRGGADYTTAPAGVQRHLRPPFLPRGAHEIREDIPQDWLLMTLTEGKHRQVRKMLQAVGHPCHRLVRLSIVGMALGELEAGGVREMGREDFFGKLGLMQHLVGVSTKRPNE